ncbi:MAG: FAD-binding oxidoreductase [Rhodothermales bacterium]
MTEKRTPFSAASADELAQKLRGDVIRPGHQEYDQARKVYNAMIDRRPGAIAYCADVADVIAAVEMARDHDALLAIRGGGHNGAGLGICDGGLVLDLSRMRGIRVDPRTRSARVDGGCTWGDVDHATHAFGLAAPSGIISTTGVGGLTLGGGIGNLTRMCGLTVDNLLEADVVTADGELITASPDAHDDLFWALRGGGGNFGVVTSFSFNLHPVHTITGGPTFWHLDRTKEVMQWYREFILEAPEELNGWFAFLTVPPVAPFPEELHHKKMCGILWCYAGHPADADAVFKPMRDLNPDLYGIQQMPLPGLQSAFDGLYPPGHQWYWKADFFKELSDDVIDRHIEFAHRLPTPQSAMHLYPINGAAHRKGRHDTAWSYREANWGQVIVGVDPDPAKKDVLVEWARAYWEATHPYSSGGAYVNMMMDEGEDRVKASYRDNYERLARIKTMYDADNLFRVNQNIKPAVQTTTPN